VEVQTRAQTGVWEQIMKERGILFTPDNHRAILERRKTQTRRVMNPQPKPCDHKSWEEYPENIGQSFPTEFFQAGDNHWACRTCGNGIQVDGHSIFRCPYGVPGDRLYVKEGWQTGKRLNRKNATQIAAMCAEAGYKPGCPLRYRLDETVRQWGEADVEDFGEWGRRRSARFMPKWAARTWLDITDVRVERLQDISEEDAIAEGSLPWIGNKARGHGKYLSDKWAIECFARLWESINAKKHPWSSNPYVWAITFKVAPEPK
jgi:hypothetical protein